MTYKGPIIIGIVIFAVVFTLPFWLNVGKSATPPKLEVGTTEKECVESKEFMKKNHMLLLNHWRDAVVREGKRVYKSSTYPNKPGIEMSLQNTCTKCHAQKDKFCDRCHDYVEVKPDCWACHLEPKKVEQQAARSDK